MRGHRSLGVLRGTPSETASAAAAMLQALSPDDVLWVSPAEAPEPFRSTAPRAVRDALGRTLHAAVLDWHVSLDPEVLGQVEGLVIGGGRLVLRIPAAGLTALPGAAHLCASGFDARDVTHLLTGRVMDQLAKVPTQCEPLARPNYAVAASEEQRAVVAQLVRSLSQPAPIRAVLLAGRGRGKSSALGLALRGLEEGVLACVTGPSEAAAFEVLRFANAPRLRTRFVPLAQLLHGAEHTPQAIVVDEAAQLPVPMLQELCSRHSGAHLVFATTTAGYEGTGRGFGLRFVPWLRARPEPLYELGLRTPIRFAEDCPVERFVYDSLLLDAQPATLRTEGGERTPSFEVIDRDAVARDEGLLAELFGLLVHAHYRTTPRDLHALLDAPNLRVHVLRDGPKGPVIAVNLIAYEGGLDPETTEALLTGRTRLQGHALAESLVAHLGHRDAGGMRMLRSVRLATHPDARRKGLASKLVEHSHRLLEADLFGTLFGVTPELLRFRRSLSYRLVRVGASRGARTGEPSALMVRPISPAAEAVVARAQAELARDLPTQLALFEADGDLALTEELLAELRRDSVRAAPLSASAVAAAVRGYTHGPRIYEAVAPSIEHYVSEHLDALAELDAPARALVQARVRQRQPWRECAARAELPSIPAAMRALRRALRDLARSADHRP